jgi:hypothetical protein
MDEPTEVPIQEQGMILIQNMPFFDRNQGTILALARTLIAAGLLPDACVYASMGGWALCTQGIAEDLVGPRDLMTQKALQRVFYLPE